MPSAAKLFNWALSPVSKIIGLSKKVGQPVNETPVRQLIPDTTPSSYPQRQTADDALVLFKARQWSDNGYNDGNSYHSDEAYTDKVKETKQEFNAISQAIEKETKAEIKSIQDDIDDAGPNKTKADKARATKKDLEEKKDYYHEQQSLDHETDPRSECHLVIEQYRSGYNRGWNTYLRRAGKKN